MAFELSDHTKKMYNPAYEEGFLFGKEWWSKYERNRIIKLLEEQKAIECKKAVCGTIFDGHDYECLSEVIDCYIALIEG